VDLEHQFRLIAVAISSAEDETAFAAVLKGVASGISFHAQYTMQDGSKAILNATVSLLNPKAVLSCWFHVKQQVRKRKHDFVTDQNFTEFNHDLDTLQVRSCNVFLLSNTFKGEQVYPFWCKLADLPNTN
jgi:hypothetical protein